MNRSTKTRMVLLFFAAAALAACGSSVRTPGPSGTGAQEGVADYPMTVVESSEHRNAMLTGWERLFESYGVPPERRKIDLAAVTHTPNSILGSAPLKLGTKGDGSTPDEERVRLLLRDFVNKNAELLGVAANALSLESTTELGGIGRRYSFVQAGFAFPIVPPAGRLEFIVSPAAEIIQINDTAIPAADLPATPRVTREAAEKLVVGKTFTYGDIAGRPQTVTVSNPAEVHAIRLVVYPEQTEAALRIRLAWEVEAGSGLTWTVYVDAIEGQVIATRQNFQT